MLRSPRLCGAVSRKVLSTILSLSCRFDAYARPLLQSSRLRLRVTDTPVHARPYDFASTATTPSAFLDIRVPPLTTIFMHTHVFIGFISPTQSLDFTTFATTSSNLTVLGHATSKLSLLFVDGNFDEDLRAFVFFPTRGNASLSCEIMSRRFGFDNSHRWCGAALPLRDDTRIGVG